MNEGEQDIPIEAHIENTFPIIFEHPVLKLKIELFQIREIVVEGRTYYCIDQTLPEITNSQPIDFPPEISDFLAAVKIAQAWIGENRAMLKIKLSELLAGETGESNPGPTSDDPNVNSIRTSRKSLIGRIINRIGNSREHVEKANHGEFNIITLENGKKWVSLSIEGEEYLLYLNLLFSSAVFTKDSLERNGTRCVIGPAIDMNNSIKQNKIILLQESPERTTQLGLYVERAKWHPDYANYHEKYRLFV
jgi:hypothetical protein